MAIASILHRISGVVLFLLLPVIIYFLDLSLRNAGTFSNLQMLLEQFHWKLLLWVFLAALIYHVLAGIRHVLMDIGYGEHLKAGRLSALAVIILAVILTIFAGIWIW